MFRRPRAVFRGPSAPDVRCGYVHLFTIMEG